MKKRKIALSLLLIIVLLPVIGFRFYLYPRLPILNGHAAKNMCSCVFLAGIPANTVKQQELDFFPASLTSIKVNKKEKSVTASVWGFRPKTAYYREGFGCALFNQKKPATQARLNLNPTKHDSLAHWFAHQGKAKLLDAQQQQKLTAAMDWAFRATNPEKLYTRAILVVYKGQLVGERYAKGFDKNSRLMGWSMTKGITAILYGILIKKGKLKLDQPFNMPGWKGTDKEKITLRNLLNMQSGLKWNEDYGNISSVTKMLYESDALGITASKVPLEFQPGTHWKYSSGTSNILSFALSNYFPDKKSYQLFPYQEFLYRIGAYSMVLETDANGYFVGSSYSWATARDWAKIGLFMLNEGSWAGKQIIDKSYVDFMRKPLPKSQGHYGGAFWLNDTTDPKELMPDVPKDAYSFRGFHGQRVQMIPSKDLVIVRLGETHNDNFNFNLWTKKVIEAIGK
ncbi:serine hydrolase domain-containing protein [Microscilla marina]|uniref:Beta-lactamase n=1 Tax=Microscilla marina ATCC 23134 TaxID=313606 RepID=A1ZCY9_MICM2|nr:serine hydrolase [Microscilla marina]EAY31528.1 beta-lactamase [Microscilla marina ATCC 23134]